jgi:hypothetical protein
VSSKPRLTAVVAAMTLLLALLFGAVDQYLGSLVTHGWGEWTVAISQMSATWLVLPFFAGMTQRTSRRGCWLGLTATYVGLLGYFLMTLSPVECVSLARVDLFAFVHSQTDLLVGGLVTGPVFGYLGTRWRTARIWWSPMILAICACLEPVARIAVDRLIAGTWVWVTEVAAGLCFALLLVTRSRRLN